MRLDRSELGGWSSLPFFRDALPGIEDHLAAETRPVYPAQAHVFRALRLTPPDAVKVVILGQDPYHTAGKADGLAFSIPQEFGGKLDSLGNIFKEIEADVGEPRTRTDLSDWARQGVLLLNTALTVPEAQPKAHAKIGWDRLVAEVLDHLAATPRAYLLWGKPAQLAARHVDPTCNLKIETAHPSPLSAHRGFLGARPFSRTNAWLQARGIRPINWANPEAP